MVIPFNNSNKKCEILGVNTTKDVQHIIFTLKSLHLVDMLLLSLLIQYLWGGFFVSQNIPHF